MSDGTAEFSARTLSYDIAVPAERLDLDFCFSSGQVFRWQKLDDGRWLGADGPWWFVIAQDEDTLHVESNATEATICHLCRLDLDAEFVERMIVRKAPELQPYMGALKGLRVLRYSNPVEAFFTFLCTPNNNIKRIAQMVNRLAQRGQPIVEFEGRALYEFPDEEVIAAIPEEELRSEGFGYRGRTIPHLANQLVERGGFLYLRQLALAPYKDAHK